MSGLNTDATAKPPVRDCEGREWARVRVLPRELTCTGCGEVCLDGRCVRCGTDEHGELVRRRDMPALVETMSYLREGEWERVASE